MEQEFSFHEVVIQYQQAWHRLQEKKQALKQQLGAAGADADLRCILRRRIRVIYDEQEEIAEDLRVLRSYAAREAVS